MAVTRFFEEPPQAPGFSTPRTARTCSSLEIAGEPHDIHCGATYLKRSVPNGIAFTALE